MQEFDLNVEQLQEILNTLEKVDIDADNSSNHTLRIIRIQLQTAKKQIGKLMSDTSKKSYAEIIDTYEDGEIEEYIDCIIEGAWTADSSTAEFVAEHEDIQNIRCFGEQIKQAIESSPFGIKNFKIKHLQPIRTKLASSKTIHELRQWCKMIALQLEYFRNTKEELEDTKESVKWLTAETDRMYKVTKEACRVVNCVIPYYEVGLNDVVLLKNIENAKKVHNLSDAEASKLFGVSRTKLLALRNDIDLKSLTPEQIETLRNEPRSEIIDMILEEVQEESKQNKTEEDLEFEDVLELHSNLDDILPWSVDELEAQPIQ